MSVEYVASEFLRGEVLAHLQQEGFADVEVEIRHIDGCNTNWTAVLIKPVGQDGGAARRAIITRIQPTLRSQYHLETG